jgi:hypothetical protein
VALGYGFNYFRKKKKGAVWKKGSSA